MYAFSRNHHTVTRTTRTKHNHVETYALATTEDLADKAQPVLRDVEAAMLLKELGLETTLKGGDQVVRIHTFFLFLLLQQRHMRKP
jgi:hypothetical protein